MRITSEVEKRIIELSQQGLNGSDIAKKIKCSRRSVFYVLKNYRMPEKKSDKKNKNMNIGEIISLRLLKNAGVELLAKMFVTTVYYKKPETIYVSERVQKIIDVKKIKKIVSIAEYAGLDCNIKYESANFA